jgi:hypothetical protein
MSKPMSDERLLEIRRIIELGTMGLNESNRKGVWSEAEDARYECPYVAEELLAEVERLRERSERLYAALESLATECSKLEKPGFRTGGRPER